MRREQHHQLYELEREIDRKLQEDREPMIETKIEWTHFPGYDKGMSWNPLRARWTDKYFEELCHTADRYGEKQPNRKGAGHFCLKIDPGCAFCYASSLNVWRGNGLEYLRKNANKIEFYLDEKTLLAPLKMKHKVCFFTNSQTDLYLNLFNHEKVGEGWGMTEEMLARIYAVMALTPQHLYLNLTKRSKARREWLTNPKTHHKVRVEVCSHLWDKNKPKPNLDDWPLPNVFEGSSIACQKDLHQLDALVQTPAWKRFVSYEPAIERIDLSRYLTATHGCKECGHEGKLQRGRCEDCGSTEVIPLEGSLSWVIIGGESGPHARPFDLQWARDTIRQCREADVPCFVKQVGTKPYEWRQGQSPISRANFLKELRLHDKKGGSPDEWPEDIAVREFPEVR